MKRKLMKDNLLSALLNKKMRAEENGREQRINNTILFRSDTYPSPLISTMQIEGTIMPNYCTKRGGCCI